jgi:glycine/D-amino acid oxidase-like deaminating enzyme
MNDYDDSKTIARDNIALKHMLSFLQTAFPKSFQSPDYERDVLYDWTGVQGLTKSGASYVGRPSTEKPGEFMSVGHNGEGMTRCFACASVATDAIIAYLDEREYSPPSWLPLCYRYNI